MTKMYYILQSASNNTCGSGAKTNKIYCYCCWCCCFCFVVDVVVIIAIIIVIVVFIITVVVVVAIVVVVVVVVIAIAIAVVVVVVVVDGGVVVVVAIVVVVVIAIAIAVVVVVVVVDGGVVVGGVVGVVVVGVVVTHHVRVAAGGPYPDTERQAGRGDRGGGEEGEGGTNSDRVAGPQSGQADVPGQCERLRPPQRAVSSLYMPLDRMTTSCS